MAAISIKNSFLKASINPKGAELISLKSANREYIWEGDPAFWGKHSPVLFPIVGTLKNNKYQYRDKEFKLSRHGFARDMVFEVLEQTESAVVFSLKASEETLELYPFPFELQLQYVLEGHQLKICYKVFNHGSVAMPFSLGVHPAFALPNDSKEYALAFNHDEQLQYFLLENDLLSDTTATIELKDQHLSLDYALFENDALVFKELNSDTVAILENGKPLLEVGFSGFPNLGIWTKPGAPFICIEPWFGYADTPQSNGNLFQKEGMQVLAGYEVFDCELTIQIIKQ